MNNSTMMDDEEWQKIRALLPDDLEASARANGALLRVRGIPSAEALLRMVLLYAVSDLSLQDVGAWARGLGVASVTAPSFWERLKNAQGWLEFILADLLAQACSLAPEIGILPEGTRLHVADATVIKGPAALGTDWRVHVLVNPQNATVTSATLTDEHGGEGLSRLVVDNGGVEPGDIMLGDQAYATARGIATATAHGAYVVVRLNPYSIRLCNQNHEVVPLHTFTDPLPQKGVKSLSLLLPIPPDGRGAGTQTAKTRKSTYKAWKVEQAVDWIPVRVIGIRMDNGEALWVLTTLPESVVVDTTVLAIYRIRWQVELFFKRIKSLLHIDKLPSKRGPTAQSWIIAHLVAAALAQLWLEPVPSFSPCAA